MAYIPTQWQNNAVTPVNADNLNHQEAGIVLADDNATNARSRQDVVEAQLAIENAKEVIRIASEVTRVANEVTRVANEPIRVGAETLRNSNETRRETDYNTYKNVMIAQSNVAALQSQINVNTTDLANNVSQINSNLKAIGSNYEEELLTIDYFDSLENWTCKRAGNTPSIWTTLDNKISCESGVDSYAYHKAKLNDGIVSVVIENPNTAITGWSGIVLRSPNYMERLCVLLLPQENKLKLFDMGSAIGLLQEANLVDLSTTIVTNIPISLSVEIIGNTLKAYVNNKLVMTSVSARIGEKYMYGYCGLGGDMGYVHAFSNFSIKRRKFDKIKPTMTKIMNIGSSITYGVGTTRSWGARLQDKLQLELMPNATCSNRGISGDTSAQMLARMDSALTSDTPNIVTIETSVNDTKNTAIVPFNTSIYNLRQMIKKCKERKIVPILMTATPTNPSINITEWDITCFYRNQQLNVRVRQLAMEEGIRLIDNAIAFNNDFTLLNDMIHPNDNGAIVMCNTAFDVITQ